MKLLENFHRSRRVSKLTNRIEDSDLSLGFSDGLNTWLLQADTFGDWASGMIVCRTYKQMEHIQAQLGPILKEWTFSVGRKTFISPNGAKLRLMWAESHGDLMQLRGLALTWIGDGGVPLEHYAELRSMLRSEHGVPCILSDLRL